MVINNQHKRRRGNLLIESNNDDRNKSWIRINSYYCYWTLLPFCLLLFVLFIYNISIYNSETKIKISLKKNDALRSQLADICQPSLYFIGKLTDNFEKKEPYEISWSTNNVKKIIGGLSHFLLLTNDGKVYGFGNNQDLQLTNSYPSFVDKFSEIPISGVATDIAANDKHSIVLTNQNSFVTYPSVNCISCRTSTNNFTKIAAGTSHISLTTNDNRLITFGIIDCDQYDYNITQLVNGGNQFQMIVTSTGEIYNVTNLCFDDFVPYTGQLKLITCGYSSCFINTRVSSVDRLQIIGKFNNINALTFTTVPTNHPSTDSILDISTGIGHSLYLTSAGEIYGIGVNNNGQLGNLTNNVQSITKLSQFNNVKHIATSSYGTLIYGCKSSSSVITPPVITSPKPSPSTVKPSPKPSTIVVPPVTSPKASRSPMVVPPKPSPSPSNGTKVAGVIEPRSNTPMIIGVSVGGGLFLLILLVLLVFCCLACCVCIRKGKHTKQRKRDNNNDIPNLNHHIITEHQEKPLPLPSVSTPMENKKPLPTVPKRSTGATPLASSPSINENNNPHSNYSINDSLFGNNNIPSNKNSDFPSTSILFPLKPSNNNKGSSSGTTTSSGGSVSSNGSGTLKNRYQIVSLLGRGGQGSVFEGFDMKDKKKVAVKLLSIDGDNFSALEEIIIKVKIKHHENMVPLLDVFTFKQESQTSIALVMPYYSFGDLRKLIDNQFMFKENILRQLLLQMCQALKFLFEEGDYIHGDIKPQNILVEELNDKHIHAVLADFGLARQLNPSTNGQTSMTVTQQSGTRNYMAPEILFQNKTSKKSDIYSLGCTFYQLMSHDIDTNIGSELYENEYEAKLKLKENMLSFEKYSENLVSLVLAMLERESKKRPDYDFIIDYLLKN
ncbi:hypothetical protein ABK040_004043 [Willaertia magna]